MEEREVKKPKHEKKVLDDIELLPEELEEDFSEGVDDDVEEETTKEIMVDDFRQFKDDAPADWDG